VSPRRHGCVPVRRHTLLSSIYWQISCRTFVFVLARRATLASNAGLASQLVLGGSTRTKDAMQQACQQFYVTHAHRFFYGTSIDVTSPGPEVMDPIGFATASLSVRWDNRTGTCSPGPNSCRAGRMPESANLQEIEDQSATESWTLFGCSGVSPASRVGIRTMELRVLHRSQTRASQLTPCAACQARGVINRFPSAFT